MAARSRTSVVGVDGCPGGWLCVVAPLIDAGPSTGVRADPTVACDFSAATVAIFETFEALLAAHTSAHLLAVDIPIGLPDMIGPGGRGCDVAARKVLGARQSSVFAMPSRRAVMATEYRAACEAALSTSEPPRKISKQAFNLFPKVREVDALMTPDLQDRVVECHPEVAFWSLNGRKAVALPKKVKSRPNPDGLAQRRAMLMAVGYAASFVERAPTLRKTAGDDDLLDACVNAWAAWRILRGEGVRFPPAPDHDARGLRMEIWG